MNADGIVLPFSSAYKNYFTMEAIEWIDRTLRRVEDMLYDDQIDEALEVLHKVLEEEPGYAPLHGFLGWAYAYFANDPSWAETHLRMAIRFCAEFASPYHYLGDVLNKGERYEEAIECFRAGLKARNPNRNALYEGMARAYEMLKQYRKAIRAYREAAAVAVDDYEVHRNLQSVKRCRKKRLALMFSF